MCGRTHGSEDGCFEGVVAVIVERLFAVRHESGRNRDWPDIVEGDISIHH